MKRVFLGAVLTAISHLAYASDCYQFAENLKKELGISGEYDPRLRVERKSTNSTQDANLFVEFINRLVARRNAESLILRDKSSDASLTLVTSTNYPFSEAVLAAHNIKVRIREYGVRPNNTNGPFRSTTGEFVSLEIKAKLPIEGVVVKPILKTPKSLLPSLFGQVNGQPSLAQFQAARKRIARELIEANSKIENISEVVKEVLNQIETLHKSENKLGNLTPPSSNVEYQRNAYVLEVANKNGETRKVQLTFDRAVSQRGNVSASLSPVEIGKLAPDGKYPPDVVVIEMKTDLKLNDAYVANPNQVRSEYATYYAVRRAYEKLQELTLDGYKSDRGKGSNFKKSELDFQQYSHFADL